MNLTLTKDTQQDLNDIRELIVKKDYQAFRSDRNRLKLSEVYREVMAFSGFKVEGISASCQSCVPEAINIVYNYVMHHEQQPDNREAKVIEVAGTATWGSDNKFPDNVAAVYESGGKPEIVVKHDAEPTMKNMETGEVHNLPEGFSTMEYSELMELAKLYGHTGKRISKEALIEFLTEKMVQKPE